MKRISTTIGEVCEFVGGSQPPKAEFIRVPTEGYVRFIQTRDYKTSEFLTFIPRHRTTKFCGKEDIMIGRYGPPIFQICRGLEGAYNVALMKAKPKPNIRNNYLYYLLKQKAILDYVDGLSLRTGGQTGVDLASLREYPITLPSLNYQCHVEEVLGALDAKIELNNRINAELEGMAKLLYDYWFVQFDFPMTAAQAAALGKPKLAGHPYRASGGKMIYNETLKREIPVGWGHSTIGETFKTHLGGTPSRQNDQYWNPGEVNWLSSGENPSTFVVAPDEKISKLGLVNSPAKLLPVGTVVLSIVRHLRASILGIEAATNQSVVGILETPAFKHCFIYPYIVREIPRLMVLRTGAQQPHINKGVLDDSPLVIPDEPTLDAYTKLASPLFSQIKNHHEQTQELTQLRDWLLPMLMNGQVTVHDPVCSSDGKKQQAS